MFTRARADSSTAMQNIDEPAEPNVTVVTWNLMHTDGETALARADEAIAHLRAAGPDVILLQEARVGPDVDIPAHIAAALGLHVAARADSKDDNVHGAPSQNRSTVAVLTRLPVVAGQSVPYPSKPESQYAYAELIAPSGRHLLAASAHLSWGGLNEATRLHQALDIDELLRSEHDRLTGLGVPAVAVMGGDFNSEPGTDTYRYLTGQAVIGDRSTLWLDVWPLAGSGDGATSVPDATHWGRSTAARVGIRRTDQLPIRRIDFILVLGWVYGRAGYPLRAHLLGAHQLTGIHASDHWGVCTSLADPSL